MAPKGVAVVEFIQGCNKEVEGRRLGPVCQQTAPRPKHLALPPRLAKPDDRSAVAVHTDRVGS